MIYGLRCVKHKFIFLTAVWEYTGATLTYET